VPAKKNALKTDSDLPEIEKDLQKLECLIEEMEDSRIPLNQLVQKYEEGSKLLKNCLEVVGQAKEKIEVIQVNLDKALEDDNNPPSDASDHESSQDGQLL